MIFQMILLAIVNGVTLSKSGLKSLRATQIQLKDMSNFLGITVQEMLAHQQAE